MDVIDCGVIFPRLDDVCQQVVKHAHVVAVEVIEVAFGLIAGADVVFVLVPLRELCFYGRVGAFLQLDDPVVKAPAVDADVWVHDEHDETLVVHPFEALLDVIFLEFCLFSDVVDVPHFGIVLIEGLRHVVRRDLGCVQPVRAGLGESVSQWRERVNLLPCHLLICAKRIVLFFAHVHLPPCLNRNGACVADLLSCIVSARFQREPAHLNNNAIYVASVFTVASFRRKIIYFLLINNTHR